MVKSIFYQTYLKAFENSFSIQVLNIKLTNEHKICDNGLDKHVTGKININWSPELVIMYMTIYWPEFQIQTKAK